MRGRWAPLPAEGQRPEKGNRGECRRANRRRRVQTAMHSGVMTPLPPRVEWSALPLVAFVCFLIRSHPPQRALWGPQDSATWPGPSGHLFPNMGPRDGGGYVAPPPPPNFRPQGRPGVDPRWSGPGENFFLAWAPSPCPPPPPQRPFEFGSSPGSSLLQRYPG